VRTELDKAGWTDKDLKRQRYHKMKKIILAFIALIFTALIGYFVGEFQGRSAASVEDFKVYNAWLIGYYGFPEDRKIELQDFLKARYYYFANRVPASVLGEPYDFGGVNFIGPGIGKDLTSPQHEYELFKAKSVLKKPFDTPSSVTNK
jgi:hypothetical protein